MNLKLIYLLLFTSLIQINISLFAQEDLYHFGKISSEEILYKSCEFDKDADAVVFFDIGKAWFDLTEKGFELIYEKKARIKILKESGVDNANIEIPLYRYNDIEEIIIELEANSWNMKDGELIQTALGKSNQYEARENKYWMNYRIAIPDVKPGTIIEYHYTIRSNYLLNFRDWKFQTNIPTLFSSFEARMIPFYEYMYLLQGNVSSVQKKEFISSGLERQIQQTKFRDMVYQFTLKNVPAFREVDFIASEEDYISKIDFQLSKYTILYGGSVEILTTWPKLIKELLTDESFGKFVKRAESQAKKIINLDSLALMDDMGKINAVIATIKEKYQWNGITSRYASGSVQDLIKHKSGTSGDLNLLGVGLLRAAGLEAFPVVMSTRENGKIRYDYPFSHFFNYSVIGIRSKGKIYMVDGTDPLLASNKLPSRCINDKGLVVKEDEVTWLDLSQNEISEFRTMFNIEVSADGLESKSVVVINADGYEARNLKGKYGDDFKVILRDLRSKNYILNESDLRCNNYKSYSGPYIVSFAASVENNYSGNKIFISPFLNEPISENPIKNIVRTIPVDFIYPYKKSFESKISIPEGFSVKYMPPEIKVENENISISYTCSTEGSLITAKAHYVIKKVIYPATLYKTLKTYHDTIINALNDKIVISRL
ncbi:MAG: Uncharacterized protein FD166_2190 [Bacteroidetes bacterium]|nr:MAG: Uncharacterized protein FD166_2190 [Bacteroidota bacterium]